MTILLEEHLIPFLQQKFPGVKVALGVGQHELAADTLVTVHCLTETVGRNLRAARWTTDFTVLDKDRSRAGRIADGIIRAVRAGVAAGELPVSGVITLGLPELVAQETASQAHSAVAFTLRMTGRYG